MPFNEKNVEHKPTSGGTPRENLSVIQSGFYSSAYFSAVSESSSVKLSGIHSGIASWIPLLAVATSSRLLASKQHLPLLLKQQH